MILTGREEMAINYFKRSEYIINTKEIAKQILPELQTQYYSECPNYI